MAQIVELKAYQRKTGARRLKAVPAEVVIFPGVRIERRNFSLADRLAKRKDAVPHSGMSGRVLARDD